MIEQLFENSSLLLLSLGMGSIDGFNVCSMGALILIISLVLVFKSRRLTLIAGSSFIITTVIAYGLLIFFWHKVFIYILPYQTLFEIILGSAALIGGLYLLKVFINSVRFGPTCKSNQNSVVTWSVRKIEDSFKKGGYLAILGGSIFFAIVVTVIEFPCSAALPLVFIGIVSEAGVSTGMVLLYISIYLLMYMSIEIVIFLVALFGKKIWAGSPKFIIISSLFGSLLLLTISANYLFKLNLF